MIAITLARKGIATLLLIFVAFTSEAYAQAGSNRPCDIFSAATPCVAAFSTTRAMYRLYSGPLYQVTRLSDGAHYDIGVLPDGYADAASQDTFCANTTCTITELYDQTPNRNNLTVAPPGGEASGPGPGGYDTGVTANLLAVVAYGHKVYGLDIIPGNGYRNDHTTGIPANGQPEGVYMLTSAIQVNGNACCFDFGNAETNDLDNGVGHLDAINMICCYDSAGNMFANLDLEDGGSTGLKVPAGTEFVSEMAWNDGQTKYQIYQGNAQSGPLTTTGPLTLEPKYSPMHQEGAIILGIGGDNSNAASGYFFEGAMTAGTPSTTTMNDLQDNIVNVGYAGNLALSRAASASSQYSSAYSPDRANDGNPTSGWSPQGSDQDRMASWQVDLGTPQVISEVNLVTRQDEDQPETRRNFQVVASNSSDMSNPVLIGQVGASGLPYKAIWQQKFSDLTPYRYVSFRKTANEYFFISDVRILPRQSRNLAVGSSVSASSQFNQDYGPSLAVDGSDNASNSGGWSPQGTDQDPQPWLQIDLGSPHTLTEVQLVTRQGVDQPQERRNFEVWASNNPDPTQGHVVLGSVGNAGLPYQSTWTQIVSDKTPYRYISFRKSLAEYFFVAEAKVIGF